MCVLHAASARTNPMHHFSEHHATHNYAFNPMFDDAIIVQVNRSIHMWGSVRWSQVLQQFMIARGSGVWAHSRGMAAGLRFFVAPSPVRMRRNMHPWFADEVQGLCS